MPQTPYDAVLHAARELPRAGTALTAEMLGATLLGSVYAVADGERAAAVREFVGGFLAHTARRRTEAARAARTVFAALVPQAAGADRVRPGPHPPAWTDQLGRVRLVGSWAYGDVYGDQTSYLATFAYEDPPAGGDDHAVVVLVDHNIGIVKDLFVGEPAERLLSEVRKAAETDELVWLSEIDPATLRAQVCSYLDVTDGLSTLPDGGSLATDRVLVGARLALLPAGGAVGPPPPAADPAMVESFLASPAAQALDRSSEQAEEALRYAVRLILEFTQDGPDGDPLRWSPAVVGLFLLDWVQRRAVLDDDDVVALPQVLRAWSAWAAQQRNLPAVAVAGTEEAIDLMAPEFVRLYTTGEHRGPAVTAAAQLLDEGVDPRDEPAVRRWLASYPDGGADEGNGSVNGSHVPRPR
jgi:hypothetical protein